MLSLKQVIKKKESFFSVLKGFPRNEQWYLFNHSQVVKRSNLFANYDLSIRKWDYYRGVILKVLTPMGGVKIKRKKREKRT